jgi:saccharopine dehydrogenase-like NADP-dependent oxidoreductase
MQPERAWLEGAWHRRKGERVMRILILGGAGMMSAGTARDLLSPLSSGIERVVAADTHAERLAGLGRSLPDPRLQTRVLDVTDAAAVGALLAECDLCVNGVPTFAGLQMQIFEACLKAKKPTWITVAWACTR